MRRGRREKVEGKKRETENKRRRRGGEGAAKEGDEKGKRMRSEWKEEGNWRRGRGGGWESGG